MGVPALFRWLSKRYPKITSKVIEEMPVEMNGLNIPVDMLKANPNGIEFDNLYLDMNGIVHPCTHPEDRPAPKTEDEAMLIIFEYIDRIVAMVRPRKILYMAIDGVAPRAKMNQQRSRRFRAAMDAQSKEEEEQIARERLHRPEEKHEEKFDSNCITPGTPFMQRLAECLRFYIADRQNKNSGWKNLKVILSDASVPGEGEHKIMDFIRNQRLLPKYNPNTRHVIYGLDADLIMLALATHEPYFYVLREDVFANDSKWAKCSICGKTGHSANNCTGQIVTAEDQLAAPKTPIKPFIFLHVPILREYLEFEMRVSHLPFPFDLERAIDDWVFMCFFVGNDFLPHLPSLDIREGAIEMLIEIYKKRLPVMGGYLTKNGSVNLDLVQSIMEEVGEKEDEIFRKRRENEERRKENASRRQTLTAEMQEANLPATVPTIRERMNDMSALAVSVKDSKGFQSTNQAYVDASKDIRTANMSAAEALKAALSKSKDKGLPEIHGVKRERDEEEDEESNEKDNIAPVVEAEDEVPEEESIAEELDKVKPEEEEEPLDNVRLWEPGWKKRYYENKFSVELADTEFRKKVVHAYTEGLCWVLKYYYQGCPSWKWFYPYHYSPFASDFSVTSLSKELKVKFEKGKPFKPLEQLMGVLPAASKSHIPAFFHDLMTNPESEIIDFYPTVFDIDLNGKKFSWQGVALLPFIEEKRLLDSMKKIYPDLDEDSTELNKTGYNLLYVSKFHSLFEFMCDLYAQKDFKKRVSINMNLSDRLGGFVHAYSGAVMPGSTVYSPLSELGIDDVPDNCSVCAVYYDPKPPKPDYEHPAILLPGVKLPPKTLTYDDFLLSQQGGRRQGGWNAERRENRYKDSNDRHFQSGGYDYASRDHKRYGGGVQQYPPHHSQQQQQYQQNYRNNYQQQYQNNNQPHRQDGFQQQQYSSYPPNYGWQRNIRK